MQLDDYVQTDNNIQTTKGSYGVCISMTTQWIKATQKYDGVTRTWQIGSSGAFRIRQGAGMIGQQRGDDNIIKNAGLTPIGPTKNDPSLFELVTAGFHILSIWESGWNSGHSMGTWVKMGKYQFFDPNFGLYHCDDSSDMIWSIKQHCMTYYPSLNARYLVRKVH